MYYIHTWCASRTAYLITNGSYLNGHSHSHFKSKPILTKPNQTNQTNQTKYKVAAPICLFTESCARAGEALLHYRSYVQAAQLAPLPFSSHPSCYLPRLRLPPAPAPFLAPFFDFLGPGATAVAWSPLALPRDPLVPAA